MGLFLKNMLDLSSSVGTNNLNSSSSTKTLMRVRHKYNFKKKL
jgi:hypothetical protein